MRSDIDLLVTICAIFGLGVVCGAAVTAIMTGGCVI